MSVHNKIDQKLMPNVSTSVSVQFQPEEYPSSLARAMSLFSCFGDIARIDVSLGAATGCLLVTFFDVRSAMQVVSKFGGYAEYAPGAQHDFRAVSIAGSVFVELPAALSGFHTFGDIAGVSICGDDVVVEFYDMRAAQQVTFTVPGSRARHQVPPHAQVPYPEDASPASLVNNLMESLARVQHTVAAVTAKATAGTAPDFVVPSLGVSPTSTVGSVQSGLKSPAVSGVGGGSPTAASVQTPASGKPVREKVNSKDLTKFDILPEKIVSGEETRTTVMVRNIPKACTRESFVEMLTSCKLGDRYTFFYMPFDKRRSVHCGFAFVNFKAPHDVLTLQEGILNFLWHGFPQGARATPATPPALSYARLQGQEQLMKHFSLSAVMYDSDARKRPQFIRGNEQGAPGLEQHSPSENTPAKVVMDHGPWVEDTPQPKYISIGGNGASNSYAKENATNDSCFLLSNAAGG